MNITTLYRHGVHYQNNILNASRECGLFMLDNKIESGVYGFNKSFNLRSLYITKLRKLHRVFFRNEWDLLQEMFLCKYGTLHCDVANLI